jgi:hypothetical protein
MNDEGINVPRHPKLKSCSSAHSDVFDIDVVEGFELRNQNIE